MMQLFWNGFFFGVLCMSGVSLVMFWCLLIGKDAFK